MPRALLFDIGNVLVRFDFTHAADGVHLLDTTHLNLDEVIGAVVALAKEIA